MTSSAIDHGELRDSIRQFLEEASDPKKLLDQPEDHSGSTDGALWDQIAELGWFGLIIDEQYDGLGLGLNELAVLYEELGRSLSPLPILQTMLAADTINMGGTEPQKKRWLHDIALGKLKIATVLPPDDAVLPFVDAELRITGLVCDVPFVDQADLLCVPVISAGDRRAVAFLSKNSSGTTIEPQIIQDLSRNIATIRFDNVAITDQDIVHLSDADWQRLQGHAYIALASDAVGGMQYVLDMTVDYLKVREQFGRPIGSFQALKHRCASWKVLQEAAIALSRNAVSAVATGEADYLSSASAAKYYSCDIYSGLSGDAVQLHGGIGFTWEHPCHLFLKRAKLNQVLFGSSHDHKDKIAGFVL